MSFASRLFRRRLPGGQVPARRDGGGGLHRTAEPTACRMQALSRARASHASCSKISLRGSSSSSLTFPDRIFTSRLPASAWSNNGKTKCTLEASALASFFDRNSGSTLSVLPTRFENSRAKEQNAVVKLLLGVAHGRRRQPLTVEPLPRPLPEAGRGESQVFLP